MKTSSIRIGIEDAAKAKIEAYALGTNRSVSDIPRQAVASAIIGDTPGQKERLAFATFKRSANHLLEVLESKPIELQILRSALIEIRAVVHELVQCR